MAKYHPRWQPTCGQQSELGRCQIKPGTFGQQSGTLSLNHQIWHVGLSVNSGSWLFAFVGVQLYNFSGYEY
jgi:hypothetical protein